MTTRPSRKSEARSGPRGDRALGIAVVALVVSQACSGQGGLRRQPRCKEEPPAWLQQLGGGACALGMAGRAADPGSKVPLELARNRAAWALAVLDGATVVSAVRVIGSTSYEADQVLSDRVEVLVARSHVERLAAQARADVWKDTCGTGPLHEPGFSYARLCRVGPRRFPTSGPDIVELEASSPPAWLDPSFTNGDKDRFCVLVRSSPTYDPARIFGLLLEDAASALPRYVESEVSSGSIEVDTPGFGQVKTDDSSVGTGVVLGAYLSDLWVDHAGRAGPRGTWYARACRARQIGAPGSTKQPDPLPYP